ncbi:cilia- and flagella-associated protein 54-like [Phragmites australis]|uniref:cilia- and flagella-associated protein 54-like n=1 Tax=Phragmites australis TaxID=29695 RepID=UPI002D793717|nr:cilia- and flagella-associated protein 54-like [Phragmites australis]
MHLLHRSSMLGAGAGGGRALRRVGSSPRALLRSESIKKRSAKKSGIKGSKRAQLRAGLAAALLELRLAGRQKRGPVSAAAADSTRPGADVGGPSCADAAAAAIPARAAAGPEGPASSGGINRATLPPLLLALVALACVVALGRAPAVCCCTCAAWWCRGPSAYTSGRRRSGVLSSSVQPQAVDGSNTGAAGRTG